MKQVKTSPFVITEEIQVEKVALDSLITAGVDMLSVVSQSERPKLIRKVLRS